MPVTIKVNGIANSLIHKGSNAISAATIPDVCKTPTPGGPVPIPYPNISQSATLDKGTTTVKADGGMMIAIKGSEFSLSNGDEPGTVGGVKSNTFIKESTWILYSFDVKMDGKNACRLTDKKFQNHENTADLGGALTNPTPIMPVNPALEQKCAEMRSDILEKYGKLGKELRKYDPVSDAKGGFVKHGGLPGLTKPGGHYQKIRDLQRGLKSDLGRYAKECSSAKSGVKIDRKVDAAASREVPPPTGMPRIPL
jgi:hypothetical protein